MSEPVITALLPTYNDQKYIEECVDSILNQTYGDFELLIVDGGSTDGTLSLCRSIPDERIQVLESGGFVESLNHGVRNAKGEFIARVDADTVLDEERFAKQVREFAGKPDLGIVGSQIELIDEETGDSWIREVPLSDCGIKKRLLDASSMMHPTWMIRSEVFDEVGLYRDYLWEDYEFLTRVMTEYKLHNLSEVLVKEYLRPGSIQEGVSDFRAISGNTLCRFLALLRGRYSHSQRLWLSIYIFLTSIRKLGYALLYGRDR